MSKLNTIFTYLKQLFNDPKTELHYENDFQLICAVILSAQTTDTQVNKVTSKLFKIVKIPQNIIHIGQNKLEKSISSVNYYKNKSKYIFSLSQILIDKNKLKKLGISKYKEYGDTDEKYYIPTSLDDLQKLPGVGEKTAKVVSHVIFGLPVIAVDTHVHRVCNRWGIVSTKTPEQTSKLLEIIIPKIYKPIAHHSIILFGRYYCTARNPKCQECKLQTICTYYQDNIVKK